MTILRREVTVKEFGAKGDGVTDDTTKVQAALNSGAVVHFPEGTYKVTTINIPNTVSRVTCDGVVIDSATSGAASAVVTIGGSLSTGTTVTDLDLQINITISNASTLRAIAARSLQDSRIHDCNIIWTVAPTGSANSIRLAAITNGEPSRRVEIANNRIVSPANASYTPILQHIIVIGDQQAAYGGYFAGSGVASPAAADCTHITVQGNYIEGGSHGIGFNSVAYSTIVGNRVTLSKHRCCVIEPTGHHNTVVGNSFTEYGSSAFLMAYGCYENVIANNSCYSSIADLQSSIILYVGCEDNVITGNKIKAASNYGIMASVAARRNLISHNHIEGFLRAGIILESEWRATPHAGAVYTPTGHYVAPPVGSQWAFNDTEANVLCGNVIGPPATAATAAGIYLSQITALNGANVGVSRNEIIDNVLTPAGVSSLTHAVFLAEQASGFSVDNTIRGTRAYGVTSAKWGLKRGRSHFRATSDNDGLDTDVVTLAAGTTEPDVGYGATFHCANTGATSITDLINGHVGQTVDLRLDGNTTVVHSAGTLNLRGAANASSGAVNAYLTLRNFGGSTGWVEMARNF